MTDTSLILQEQNVSNAFSRQSSVFDDIYENNPITLIIRQKARNEVLGHISPGDHILELNCGTGIDTMFFAGKGFKVMATDNAGGMLQKLSEKIAGSPKERLVSVRKCSFNDLTPLHDHRYDYIFSNFGGLNCTSDLASVLKQVDQLLKPGGHFTFVLMPKICPWEIASIFKGRQKVAFRRFKKAGTNAHIEGVYFKCYYYSPSYFRKHIPVGYARCSLKGMASFMPPPFMDHFPVKYPKLFSMLKHIEDKVCDKFPFNRWCDQYVITMRKGLPA